MRPANSRSPNADPRTPSSVLSPLRDRLALTFQVYYHLAIGITIRNVPSYRVKVMQISTITTKGQITIPAALRKRLGLQQGDEVAFIIENGKVVLMPVEKNIEAAFGLVKASRTVSLEAMEKAIRKRADGDRR